MPLVDALSASILSVFDPVGELSAPADLAERGDPHEAVRAAITRGARVNADELRRSVEVEVRLPVQFADDGFGGRFTS